MELQLSLSHENHPLAPGAVHGSACGSTGCSSKQLKPQAASKAATRPDNKSETPHLEFVTEYIRELAAIQDIRESAESDLKQDPEAVFSNCIHSSTLMQLELGSQISQLSEFASTTRLANSFRISSNSIKTRSSCGSK
jgi:hypothetical protein